MTPPALTYCPRHGHPAVECLRCAGEDYPTLLDVEPMWDAPIVPEPQPPRVSHAPGWVVRAVSYLEYAALAAACIALGRLAWHAARAVVGH